MKLTITKKADDTSLGMQVLRISIGGLPGDDRAYITYRGDLVAVQDLLTAVAHEFAHLAKEPPISPDDGKRYA